MLQFTIDLRTSARDQMIEVTDQVRAGLAAHGVRDGVCLVASPHTTAGVTINEGYDPDVARDMLVALERCVPHNGDYRHAEGNAAAHVKATLVGASQWVPVLGGELQLGTWQTIWFCEFDGPRQRRLVVSVLESSR